mmetsp:Transcript_29872/g.67572  ORF Transcript_29872/g.67572 Transcript_29872/m.67572 type:complete len:127 (-) Transcript_29872:167-547(-)
MVLLVPWEYKDRRGIWGSRERMALRELRGLQEFRESLGDPEGLERQALAVLMVWLVTPGFMGSTECQDLSGFKATTDLQALTDQEEQQEYQDSTVRLASQEVRECSEFMVRKGRPEPLAHLDHKEL